MLMFGAFGESRPHLYVLDEEHHVIPLPNDDKTSVLMWVNEMEGPRRIVEQTTVKRWFGTFWVSTIFLGMDFRIFEGPPILFETMVFEQGRIVDQARYENWEAAKQGHWTFVALARTMPVTIRVGLRIIWQRVRASWERHKEDMGLPMPVDDGLAQAAHNVYEQAAAFERRRRARR